MNQLLERLGISLNQNVESILEELKRKLMECWEYLDEVEDRNRYRELKAEINEIEDAIYLLMWETSPEEVGMMWNNTKWNISEDEMVKYAAELKDIVGKEAYDAALYLMEESNDNIDIAIACMRRAAERGDCLAQLYMGQLYENGNLVVRNKSRAVEWYEKAANQGNKTAQECLIRIIL